MNKRNTIQRQMVLNTVTELGNHATAEEIYQRIAEKNPQISKGTVYRNLGVLAQERQIRKIEIPGAADCYDHIPQTHYHVRCVKCGRVFDVDMELIPNLTERIGDAHGFDFLDYDIIFKGICPECKKAGEKNTKSRESRNEAGEKNKEGQQGNHENP